MSILQLILFVMLFLITSGHWFIKRPDSSKHVGYPNPGKRSLPEEDQFDCSKSFSQLHSYEQKTRWIVRCIYAQLNPTDNDNSLSSESNDIQYELPPTSRSSSHEDQPPQEASTLDNSFNQFLFKARRGGIMKKK